LRLDAGCCSKAKFAKKRKKKKKSVRSGYLKTLKEELSRFMKGLAKKTGEV